jgi:hypothetical protein
MVQSTVQGQQDIRQGYSPRLWGRTFWETLHFITLAYPESNPSAELRAAAYSFLHSLQFLLPCGSCREHLARTYKTDMPLDASVFASRHAFGVYVVELRDYIKAKHVCPQCALKSHVFPDDVEKVLLSPSRTVSNTSLCWAAIIGSLLILVFIFVRPRSPRTQAPLTVPWVPPLLPSKASRMMT